MAIEVRCLSCLSPYRLDDAMRGKKVRCKQCGNVFVVEDVPAAEVVATADADAEEAEAFTAEPVPKRSRSLRSPQKEATPSRQRSRDEEDEDDLPRKKSRAGGTGSNTTLIVVLSCVGGGVLLLVGGLVLWLVLRPSKAAPPVAAANPPVVNPVNPLGGNPPGGNQPGPRPNPNPNPNPNPPVNPLPPPPPPPPPQEVAWRVTVDPPPAPLKPPLDPKKTIPGLQSDPVLFPNRASSFVAIGKNNLDKDARQIYNLETVQQVGTLQGKLTLLAPIVLSPDGKYLAGKALGGGTTILDVYPTAGGQPRRIQVDPGLPHLSLVDFAGPDQLVTVKNGLKSTAQLWDLNTGQMLKQFDLASTILEAKNCAISPGGKFLALIDTNGKLMVYDLPQGLRVGATGLPRQGGGVGVVLPKGIAFSPDGVELAAVFDNLGAGPQVFVWDVAKGTLSKQFQLNKDLLNQVQGALIYSGPAIDWVPDRSGWLLHGFFLVDATTGTVVYTVPGNLETGFTTHRRLLDRDHLAAATGFGATRQLAILTLPRDQINQPAQGGQPVQGGQPAPVAGLPAAKPADWSAVRPLPPVEGIPQWTVQADPQPAKKLVNQPISLKSTGKEIDHVLFANKAGQVGVISLIVPTDPLRARQVRIDRYDLTTGQALGSQEVGTAPRQGGPVRQGIQRMVSGLSPEGTLLALVEAGEHKRIDIWSLKESKHIAGFLPYEKEADPKLRWVGLLDDQRLLTLGGSGKLVLWSLPDCKAVWSVDGIVGVPALSPTQKYLAAARGPALLMLDPGTGEVRGQLDPPAGLVPNNVSGFTFRPDGKALAGVVNMQLIRWDLAKGTVLASSPVEKASRHLQWCGDNHVLLDSGLLDAYLYDFNFKAVVASYLAPGGGKLAFGGPDERIWYASGRLPTEQAVFASQTVPDPITRQFVARLNQPGTQVLLKPGMTISAQVNIAGGAANPEELRKQALGFLSQRLQSGGLALADGSPFSLQIQLQENATGKTVQYRPIGGRGAVQTVQVKQIQCQATLNGPGGMIWQDKRAMETPEPLTVNSENIQAMLDQQLWGMAAGWAGSLTVPSFVVRSAAGQLEFLPRRVVLGGN